MNSLSKVWESQYNKSILAFTGRNADDAMNFGDKAGGDVTKKTSPVIDALKKLDNCDLDTLKSRSASFSLTKDHLDIYKDAIDEFAKAATTYDKILKTQVGKVDKSKFPKAYRELKVMATTLDAIEARARSLHDRHLKSTDINKINEKATKKNDELQQKNKTDEAQEVREKANLKIALKTLKTGGRSVLKKGLAAVQKVKAEPTPDMYDTEMNQAGRDVSQWLVNIDKMKKHKTLKLTSEVKALADPASFTALATEFGNGSKRKIDPAATPADVEKRIREFSQMLKGISAAYAKNLK